MRAKDQGRPYPTDIQAPPAAHMLQTLRTSWRDPRRAHTGLLLGRAAAVEA